MNLQNFISKPQYQLLLNLAQNSPEASYFKDKLAEIEQTINTMPKTYETDGQGNNAIAYLHYFKGGGDWYIVEKDMQNVQQAYGLVNLGYDGEIGYISIEELIKNDVELDLHFQPTKIKELMWIFTLLS